MADLITSARALYNLNNLVTTSNEDATIAALVSSVSKVIQRYCQRDFVSTTYDEVYHGSGKQFLTLRNIPVISVSRVAYGPATVMLIQNTSTSNQHARVGVTSTGLSLTRVASGITTADTSILFATYTTLASVATAINALGNGWTAQVASASYNLYASSDLRSIQGSMSAMLTNAELRIHVSELASFDVDDKRGLLTMGVSIAALGSMAIWDNFNPIFSGGFNFWRVIYTAGYATVPEDVQEACAQWVAQMFYQTKRDAGLGSQSVAGVSSFTPLQGMPENVKTLLKPYRDVKFHIGMTW